MFLILCSCQPDPSYNPFDSSFDINVQSLIRDDCDTVSAGCGYFNLNKHFGNYSVYYQTYMEEPNTVVAKGMRIYLDTVAIRYDMEHEHDSTMKFVWYTPIDTSKIDDLLKNFELKRSNQVNETLEEGVIVYENRNGVLFKLNQRGLRQSDKGSEIVRVFEIFRSSTLNNELVKYR